ncbi:MAG: LPS export ABC transporter permease LptG [Pseudomonadota bacterium]|nr:LPS export ABC transporter permease LptG [Pseudomonadota bacterium]
MALQLFPSRTVTLYMVRMFLVRTFAFLFVLVLVLQLLDLLSESGYILAHPGNGQAEELRYVSLRMPELIEVFLPFSVLLGTILTLSTMNQNSEVVALKAAGLSAHQVLAPLIIASFGIAALSFAFNDRIVSRATATLTQWKNVDYGPLPIDRGGRANVWVRDGEDLLQVAQVSGQGNQTKLGNVTFYDRDGNRLIGLIRAPHGVHVDGGWKIFPATHFDVATGALTQIGAPVIAQGVRPEQLTLASVDADGMSLGALHAAIRDLADAGRPTMALEGSLWHKLSGPLSAVLMPLLGAVAAFGLARSGKVLIRAALGMGLGFTYFVADNFALAMGNIGAYPPFLAAWAPFLLFLLIGEAVLIRAEE